jgi:hypothetical protein
VNALRASLTCRPKLWLDRDRCGAIQRSDGQCSCGDDASDNKGSHP